MLTTATRTGSAAAPAVAESAASAAPPRIWLVLGDKLGDNAQAEIVAGALGWPYEVKRLVVRARYRLGKPRFRPTLAHLDRARSDRLEPPWPDLVITIGRRPAMAALWAQGQAEGRFRLVLIGRPRRWIERFDLVVAPAQYRLPPRPNVLNLDFPLMRVDERAIAAAAEAWRDRLRPLPRPLTALFVGGPTRPLDLGPKTAAALARRAVAAAGEGSLYVSTSRRTPAAVVEALAAALPPGTPLYRFGAEGGGDNPYRALLGLADRFIVTADSVSMMVEVARLGKPLAIADLPLSRNPVERVTAALGRWLHAGDAAARSAPLRAVADVLARADLVGYPRDLARMRDLLIGRGLAVRLGEPFPPPGGPRAPDELPEVVGPIRRLVGARKDSRTA